MSQRTTAPAEPVTGNSRPPQFERVFRIRHYECDAYGHVGHADYLRYMQETAFDASAAVGYDYARYQAMGQHWLIRETDITYHRPLFYGDSVLVRTWVADFRRVRSRRMYQLWSVSTGELAATASTEWVFLDSKTLRPMTVPPEMVAAFWHPAAAPGQRREPFPEAPEPPPGEFRMRYTVQWRDIDQAQHVNNANYVAYIQECSVQVAAAFGWPLSRLLAMQRGIVARHYRIEYREPALLGDELEISTFVSEVKRATAVRHYQIRRVSDGSLLARAHVLWVWVDLQTGQPQRIPLDFIASFQPNIASS